MRRWAVATVAAFLVGAAVGGVAMSTWRPAHAPAGQEAVPAAPSLRPGETAGPPTVATDGQLAFRVLGWQCGIRAVMGDHADWLPDGQYCRVRLRVANRERSVTRYDTSLQTLRDARAREFPADLNAVSISDQPTTTEMKGRAVQEFDVWFEIPAAAEPVELVLHAHEGSAGATVALAP